MRLFRLTFITLFARKGWVLAFASALALPFFLPYLTPYEGNVKLIAPARAQVAWSVAWLIAIFWSMTQAAMFGESNSRTGLGAYFRSAGVSRMSQLFQIWLANILYLLPVVLIAFVICLVAAMPGNEKEAEMWVATNLQYAALFALTIAPLVLLAVALASRFGSLVGFVTPMTLCLYGLYGVGHLGEMIKLRENPVLEWIYAISPHYHLADLTPRLVFKMGQYPTEIFASLATYFLGIMLVFGVAATGLFKTDPLKS